MKEKKKRLNMGGVSQCGLAIYIFKSILLRQKKKNYGNSNIWPCKNIESSKKSSKTKPKSFKIL
jgi:hypothetical protein